MTDPINRVTVTVSGPVGSGKSAVYHEIVVALKALGVEVRHEAGETPYLNEAGIAEHQNSPGDAVGVDRFDPVVTMREAVERS